MEPFITILGFPFIGLICSLAHPETVGVKGDPCEMAEVVSLNDHFRAGRITEVVKCLSNKHVALNSNNGKKNTKNKTKQNKQKKRPLYKKYDYTDWKTGSAHL
jgi:hypothetical protein